MNKKFKTGDTVYIEAQIADTDVSAFNDIACTVSSHASDGSCNTVLVIVDSNYAYKATGGKLSKADDASAANKVKEDYEYCVLNYASDILSEEDVLEGIIASAEESCETILHIARDARYAAQNKDWEGVMRHLKRGQGYGYFDDEFHLNLVQEFINRRNEHV